MDKKHEILQGMVQATNGKFFTIVFLKKDKTERKMLCRLGVKKHLKGNGPSTTAHIDNYMTVYDVKSRGYRTINLDTVKNFKCGQFEHKA